MGGTGIAPPFVLAAAEVQWQLQVWVAAAGESDSPFRQTAVVLGELMKAPSLVAEEVMVAESASAGSGVEGASVVDFARGVPSRKLLGGSREDRIWMISNRAKWSA